jgi:hypothetical protein
MYICMYMHIYTYKVYVSLVIQAIKDLKNEAKKDLKNGAIKDLENEQKGSLNSEVSFLCVYINMNTYLCIGMNVYENICKYMYTICVLHEYIYMYIYRGKIS